MAEKSRTLPSWMSKRDGKRKTTDTLKSFHTPKTLRSVFYCMNEKELTEAAASCLAADPEVELITTHKAVEEPEGPELKKSRTDSPASNTTKKTVVEEFSSEEDTHVSESDLDVSELQTVPYSESSERRGAAEGRTSVQEHDSLKGDGQQSETADLDKKTKEEAEEDDELRLVREIFFS
ncbi:cell cycle regulator of non-homologous end joining-like [Synchiropus splendidus]|uniref:cell cycle regulator of non-homologous end joining-like n=1 Tax=Synchiropus splendidus TaxID=270530 RepID=UPI00237DB6F6|nr:cell cycle regulator of non-homologous end joining-like [Synchiropus splendidus]